MTALIILTGILIGAGLFYILSDLYHVPSIAASRAVNSLGRRTKKKNDPIELWLKDLSQFIAARLHLNEYKKAQLEADLKSADMAITPEEYIAGAITKALFLSVFSIPLFFFFPVGAVLVLVFSAYIYHQETRKVFTKLKERRDKIEYELPRFTGYVEKTLKHSRDVLGMLEGYSENAGPELKRELMITLADMRSGSMEAALTRLEARIGSSMMSDVIRGLVGILRGDDTAVYWASLSMKFAEYQRQLLKRQAKNVPRKVRRLSMVLLTCFMAIYIVVIGQVLLSSLSILF